MKNILYCVYALFFSFIVWHVMFAIDGFDGAVKNSYDKGMEYPRELARKQELGLVFQGSPDRVLVGRPVDIVLHITAHGEPVSGAHISMEVARPASQHRVETASVKEVDGGHYRMKLVIPEHGHWLVTARVGIGDEAFTHEFRIYADMKQTTSLL